MTGQDLTKLKYEQRFVVFIDVLGFSSLISDSVRSATDEEKTIERISNTFLWSLQELEEIARPHSSVVFTHFSDSFVISAPANTKKYDIYKFSLMISIIVDCFLASNLFLRGGITRGKLIHNDRLLFGPAMNVAYNLEAHVAKYPRIIIDPYIQEFEHILHPEWLDKDDDGLVYINYFKPQKAFFLIPGWLHCIQEAIENVPRTPNLHNKRKWLVKKYNNSLSSFSFNEFKSQIDEKANDPDDDRAIYFNYDEILATARKLHPLD